jgi:hypothetical protein
MTFAITPTKLSTEVSEKRMKTLNTGHRFHGVLASAFYSIDLPGWPALQSLKPEAT